jgi:outer membrane protein assembly factor BamD (BamD/ComL family)
MSSQVPKETRFGEIALSMRLVTSEQLEECLQIQRRLSEMGVDETLGEVLVKKGYLGKEQVGQVLGKMGIDVQVIPQYRLIARLGRGGMGAVYKALHVSMNRVVALKILDREATASKPYVERFLREARQAAQLSHPNIVRAFDAGQANGLYYFAMEYIAGETAHRQVKRGGPYSEKKTLDVLRQIADALGYIAKRGLVHRDVKPENILIDRQGRAYLCDFGLAKSMVDGTLTRSGFTFGTPYYMSPEQIEGGRSLDVRSDLYSLGACLHFLTTGRPPFEAADLQAILSKHLTDRPPSPKAANPAVSDGLCSIYFKLMEKDRENRYANARELAADLRRVSGGLAPKAGGGRRGLSRALAACAALVLAAAVAAGGALLFRNDPKPAKTPSGSAASGAKPAPKPEASRPTEPGAAQAPREDRERQARELFEVADKAFQDGNWPLAHSTYEKIDTDFDDTDLFRENRMLVFERAAYCLARAESLADASTRQLSEKHKRARGLYEQAFTRMNGGDWGEAIVLFQQLLDADVMEVVSAARLQQLIERCQGEQRAVAEWQKIQDAAAGKAWDRVLAEGAQFRSEYRSSQTLATVAAYLDGHEKRARREIEASGKLGEVLASYEKRAWGFFRDQVAAFLGAYAETDTAQTAREGLLAKVEESRAAEREPFEKAAQALFDEATRDLAAKNHAAAKPRFERLLAEHAGTEFVVRKRAEIDKALAEIAKAELAQRDKEFQRRYKDVAGLFNRKKYDEAMKGFDDLMAEYPEREFWDSKQKEVETFLERAEQEVHRDKYALRQDFEDGPSGWTRAGPGDPRIEGSDNHVGGRRGARVQFNGFPEPNEWARVWRRVDKGLSPQLKSISFMAYSADRSVMSILPFVMTRVGGKEYFYMAERQIGGAWSKIRIAMTEFRPIQGQENPPKLDPQDIRGFGFAHPGRTMTRAFFLDDIDSEFK